MPSLERRGVEGVEQMLSTPSLWYEFSLDRWIANYSPRSTGSSRDLTQKVLAKNWKFFLLSGTGSALFLMKQENVDSELHTYEVKALILPLYTFLERVILTTKNPIKITYGLLKRKALWWNFRIRACMSPQRCHVVESSRKFFKGLITESWRLELTDLWILIFARIKACKLNQN